MAKRDSKERSPLVQTTRNVGGLHVGQTLRRDEAERRGLKEGSDIQDFITDRAVKPEQVTKRSASTVAH